MTGDDIFELSERLDRIAVAVERIAGALEPTVSVRVESHPNVCGNELGQDVCQRPLGHAGMHKDDRPRGITVSRTWPWGV